MKAMASNQNISWFYQRFKEDSLELSPEFQRNPVWQQPQKDYLIETILLGLPIPEIYYVTRINPKGESIYVVVDGQQRLRTVIEFVNNEHIIKSPVRNFADVRKFNDLSDTEKQRIWRYPIVVRDLEDSSDDDVRDLFQRLNKYSFVLNDQELRNARFKGEFLKLIEKLGEKEFWTGSGIFSANDIRRMLDLEYISILLTSLIGGIYNRKERINEFYVQYEDEFDEANYYSSYFTDMLETIDSIFPNIRRTKWKNKVNFYSLFLCIDTLKIKKDDQETLTKLKSALGEFESQLEIAKNTPEESEPRFLGYLDAATFGTNDKEKRIRRHKILSEYLKSIIR